MLPIYIFMNMQGNSLLLLLWLTLSSWHTQTLTVQLFQMLILMLTTYSTTTDPVKAAEVGQSHKDVLQ